MTISRRWNHEGRRGFAGSVVGGLLLLLVLAGCVLPAPEDTLIAAPSDAPTGQAVTSAAPTELPPTGLPTVTHDPAAPVILLAEPVGAETLSLIRFESAGQDCLTATFNPRIFGVLHCGPFSGVGVGFVDTLTDAAGQTVRAAYGLALDPTITAVAVEFSGGGSASVFVQQGAYLLVPGPQQIPRRALGINQFGNLVGSWQFE